MRHLRRFSSAFLFSLLVAAAMTFSTVALEAAAKKGGPHNGTICEYLKSIIDYPYTSEWIMAYVLSLYNFFGCGG